MYVNTQCKATTSEDYVDDLRLFTALSNKSIPRGSEYGMEKITKGTSISDYVDSVGVSVTNVLQPLSSIFSFKSFNPTTSLITISNVSGEDLEVIYED